MNIHVENGVSLFASADIKGKITVKDADFYNSEKDKILYYCKIITMQDESGQMIDLYIRSSEPIEFK